MPFDIETFYEQARSGDVVDTQGVLQWIKSFESVILWGAGNLGTAVGEALLREGVTITEYWDRNAATIRSRHDIPVAEPFHRDFDAQTTLCISCITNGAVGDTWPLKMLKENGYIHILLGMELFEGVICQLSIYNTNIEACASNNACSLCNCKRYISLSQNKFTSQQDSLAFQLITFIISTKCTLKCKYCGQFITKYNKKDRVNYPIGNILRDIDNFINAVDFVGMISVIGGEPFLHEHIGTIVTTLLTYKNFGIINITTNGVVKISRGLLQKLRNPRVKISFSSYAPYLNAAQKRLFDLNVATVAEEGLNYSVGVPIWLRSEYRGKLFNIETAIEKKKNCKNRIYSSSVRDGKFIPCTTVEVTSGLNLIENSQDYVDVTSTSYLKQRIRENLEKKYYISCQYCLHNSTTKQIPAGEQQ